jgi:uncharacterized membrane protein SirB2
MDVTEAFESYHITEKPSQVLAKYYIRDAISERNYRITYKADGFYRIFKARVAKLLPTLDNSVMWKSKLCIDILVFGFLLSSVLAVRVEWILSKIFFILLAGQLGLLMFRASHNFMHQKNNWRMFLPNLMLVSYRDWRVIHAIVSKSNVIVVLNIYIQCFPFSVTSFIPKYT